VDRLIGISLGIVVVLGACKKHAEDSSQPAPGPQPGAQGANEKTKPKARADEPVGDQGAAAPTVVYGSSLKVKHSVADFSGSYDTVFAQLKDGATYVAWVRDCPKLTCDGAPFEIETVAKTCPKAYTAVIKVDNQDLGKSHPDIKFSGPADSAATATLEHASVNLTKVGNDGVSGSLSLDNTDSSAHAQFEAQVCPQT
jgi:hypothetical protein